MESSGTSLQSWINPSVRCGTTLSIKYWRIGCDLWSRRSLSCWRISSRRVASFVSRMRLDSASSASQRRRSSASYSFLRWSSSSRLIRAPTSSSLSESSASFFLANSARYSEVKSSSSPLDDSARSCLLSSYESLVRVSSSFCSFLRNLVSASVIKLRQQGLPFFSVIIFIDSSTLFSSSSASGPSMHMQFSGSMTAWKKPRIWFSP